MSSTQASRDEMEATVRRLLTDHGLPQPDEICPHEDGGIVCLWHEEKVAVIFDPDEGTAARPDQRAALGPGEDRRAHVDHRDV